MQNNNNTNNNGDSSTNYKLDIDKNLSVGTVLSRYYSNRNKHYLYGFVSFLMTAAFYVVFISPGIEQVFNNAFDLKVSAWVWAFIGLLFSVVITILIMHSHTTDRPQSKYTAYAMVIVLGVAFNLFTEVSSTSDRVQERVTIKSENSALFKALTEKAKHSTGQANTSLTKARNDYADAVSTAKARCKKGDSYSKRLCTKWTMRADEYKTAMSLHKAGATTELQETVKLAKEASNDTKNAQMTIQLVMEQLGVTFRVATMLVSLFMILTYEILGATIGYDYRRYRDALPHYGIDLHADKEAKAESKKLESEVKQLEAETRADEKRMDAEIKQMEVDLKRYQKEVEHQAKADKLRAQLAKFKESLSMQASPSAGSAKVSPDDNNLSNSEHEADKNIREKYKYWRQNLYSTDNALSFGDDGLYVQPTDKELNNAIKKIKEGKSLKKVAMSYLIENGLCEPNIPPQKSSQKPSTLERQKSMINDDGMVSVKSPLKTNDKDDNHDGKVSMYKHACNNMDKSHGLASKLNSHPKSKKIRLDKSLKAKKGDEVHCPECGKPFVKKTYNHTFCKPSCRDNYHNEADNSGKRIEIKEAVQRKRKRRAKA